MELAIIPLKQKEVQQKHCKISDGNIINPLLHPFPKGKAERLLATLKAVKPNMLVHVR